MPAIGIFVKHPIPGKVKTRLGASIGYDFSAELYTAFQLDLLERCQLESVKRILCYSSPIPESKQFFEELVAGDDELWEQPEVDLGERLKMFFREALEAHGPVIVIGSDSPTLPLEYLKDALKLLEMNDVVLGPAVDGGYYLLGLSKPVLTVFDEIEWSGAKVLEQTVQQIKKNGASLGLLPPWYDIDTLDDLYFLHGHFAAMQVAGDSSLLPKRTCEIVEKCLKKLALQT